MKILHINCNYIGTQLHKTMIQHLNRYYEIQNFIFCPLERKSNAFEENENVVLSKCFSKLDRFLYFKKQKNIFKSINSVFSTHEFSIVHAYTLFTDGGIAYKTYKKYGIPYVVAIRGTDFQFLKYKPYLRLYGLKIINNASKVFFLSDSSKDKIFKIFNGKINKNCCEVIPNGIDDYWHNNKSTHKKCLNCLNVVCVANVDKNKNAISVCKALKILEKKGYNVHFKLIGQCKDNKLLSQIENFEFVKYSSPLPKEKLINEYKENDIFVMPSFSETFGLVYVEAMSQGLPIIYSKGQGFDKQFNEGVVGCHVDPKDVNEISAGIIDCYEKYDFFSKNGFELCDYYNWDLIVEKYYNIYKKILAKEK